METQSVSESSPPIPPTDGPQSEAPITSETSRAESIKSLGKKIFEHGGVLWERMGGRPRKGGGPNRLDRPLNVPAGEIPLAATNAIATPTPGLDPILVKKCCNAVIKAGSTIPNKLLWKRYVERCDYTAQEANQLIADVSITKEEADSFSELAEICLRKYGVGTAYAPEIGMGAILIGIGARYATAFATAKKEEEAKRQMELPGTEGK